MASPLQVSAADLRALQQLRRESLDVAQQILVGGELARRFQLIAHADAFICLGLVRQTALIRFQVTNGVGVASAQRQEVLAARLQILKLLCGLR